MMLETLINYEANTRNIQLTARNTKKVNNRVKKRGYEGMKKPRKLRKTYSKEKGTQKKVNKRVKKRSYLLDGSKCLQLVDGETKKARRKLIFKRKRNTKSSQ